MSVITVKPLVDAAIARGALSLDDEHALSAAVGDYLDEDEAEEIKRLRSHITQGTVRVDAKVDYCVTFLENKPSRAHELSKAPLWALGAPVAAGMMCFGATESSHPWYSYIGAVVGAATTPVLSPIVLIASIIGALKVKD